jgi:hypothetical protein
MVIAYLQYVSWNLPEGTEENHRKSRQISTVPDDDDDDECITLGYMYVIMGQ